MDVHVGLLRRPGAQDSKAGSFGDGNRRKVGDGDLGDQHVHAEQRCQIDHGSKTGDCVAPTAMPLCNPPADHGGTAVLIDLGQTHLADTLPCHIDNPIDGKEPLLTDTNTFDPPGGRRDRPIIGR